MSGVLARYVSMMSLILCAFWFALGCPSTPVGPGDAGDGNVSESTKSDGIAPDSADEKSTTPDTAKDTGPGPEPQAEPKPEPTKEAVPEPIKEMPVLPEPVKDGGIELLPEMKPEPVVEAKPEVLPEKPGVPGIGAPCKTDADCGGGKMRCVPEGKLPQFPFPQSTGNGPPGGYCTQGCFAGGTQDCPTGSECYVPGAASGTCLKSCKADSECRTSEGYRCANDGGMQSKACFPPNCSLTQAGGNYWLNVTSSSTKGTCSQQPMKQGSRIPVSISIKAGEITFQFGSKPQSPLPVTWSLRGVYQTGMKISAANPKGCTQSCDGLLTTRINNPCLFYGMLISKAGTNCEHVYNVSFTHRP